MTNTVSQIRPRDFHPACLALPKMALDEYQALRESIRQGYDQRHPILLLDGLILDGRHRYLACVDEGVEPQFIDWTGGNPFDFVRREHEGRRSWVSGVQKAMVIGRLIKQSAAWQAEQQRIQDEANEKRAEAAKKQIAAQQRDDTGKVQSRVDPQVEGQPGTPAPPSRDHAKKHAQSSATAKAKLIGTSRANVERADMIERHSPELAEKVARGEVSATKAIQEIRKQAQIERLNEIAAQPVAELDGRYDVIVIDPPWPMNKIEREARPNQVAFDYPTMSESELSALNIPAADNCHAWLWTTHKFMPMAFRLLDKWGLKYVCTFVWHKPGGFQPVGLPQYNCEFALYARKGSPKFLDTKAFPVAFNAARGAHSEKPGEFYDVVRRVTGGRRLDMFNRRAIDGFTGWGKEAAQ